LNSTPVGQFGGYSWFISRLKSSGGGSSYQPGLLAYRRGCWSTSTTFSWVDSNWVVLNPTSMPRYFALQDADVHAPTKSGFSAELRKMGSRYMSAIIQGTNLWACQTIGLDGTDGNYGGTETGSTVDRTGIQWWKYGIESSGASLSSAVSGIIFDNAASPAAPYWFYTGSLAVNTSGDVLFGFSGSKSTEEIGAFHYGRLQTGTFPDRIALIQPGGPSIFSSGVVRWGDYSATLLDPDGSTFWTAQEYMDGDFEGGDLHWASWINSVKINP
jgi:hypothetical protein